MIEEECHPTDGLYERDCTECLTCERKSRIVCSLFAIYHGFKTHGEVSNLDTILGEKDEQ